MTVVAEAPTPLFQPENGVLVSHKLLPIEGGELFLGHYLTELATHNVNVYRPAGFDPDQKLPVVVMTTALATGTGRKSHNDGVAREMMEDGLAVILKGVPHYHGPTVKALTLTQDANETMGVVRQVELSGILGKILELRAYGESQAAMKGLCLLALQRAYGFPIPDGYLTAICYMDAINWRQPHKIAIRLGGMAASGVRWGLHASRQELLEKRGTVSPKDMHHHGIVVRRLTSGETGTFPEHIDPEQSLTIDLFGKDWDSKPYKTAETLKRMFRNMRVGINPDYGHIDGIMSEETRVQRGLMVFEARHSV